MSYFCNKCGYFGETSEHVNCNYLAADINWKEKQLIGELSATKEKLEAAERRIRESQEQEPWLTVGRDYSAGKWIELADDEIDRIYAKVPLYTIPPIPLELSELQRENAELRKKLDSMNDLHR